MSKNYTNKSELINDIENEILELVECQTSTDGRDFTQSDLQGRATVIAMNTIHQAQMLLIPALRKIQGQIEGDTFTADNISDLINKIVRTK